MSIFRGLISHSEWKSVPALSAIQQVVCRTSHRVFVGLPLCMSSFHSFFVVISELTSLGRNPDWIDLNIHYAVNVIKRGIMIGLFPRFIRL